MIEVASRLQAATMRENVRAIDRRVALIQSEQRLFRRYGFGSDVHDIQLVALRAEREDVLVALKRLPLGMRPTVRRSGGFRSWMLLPVVLGAMAFRAIQPGPRSQSARRQTATVHSSPGLASNASTI